MPDRKSLSRRQFLKGAVVIPAAIMIPGTSVVRAMMAAPGAGTKNLIFVDLKGGNDGLNTIVPYGMNGGSYYSEFRPKIAVDQGTLLPIDGALGMNPAIAELHSHFQAGRLAICQGCSYPDPSRSHAQSQRIVYTGDPDGVAPDGWFGRFLGQAGPLPEAPCAVAISHGASQMFGGSDAFVPNFTDADDFSFPYDYDHWSDKDNRRAAYTAIASGLGSDGSDLGVMANTSSGILDLIDTFETLPEFNHVGVYPDTSLGRRLQLIARLMGAGIGMRYFHVGKGGFDDHSDQNKNDQHALNLAQISQGVSALHADLVSVGLADDTIIVISSEFGRTVYENGSKGTDHGTVGPVMILGNAVSGGLTTPHPSMDPADLDPDTGELPTTTDFRDVFGTVVDRWLNGNPATIFPGHGYTDLGFLG